MFTLVVGANTLPPLLSVPLKLFSNSIRFLISLLNPLRSLRILSFKDCGIPSKLSMLSPNCFNNPPVNKSGEKFPSVPIQPPMSLSAIVPNVSSMSLPAPVKLPIESLSTFGIALGTTGVPQKLIILAIAANSATAALSLPSALSILVCAIKSSKAASASSKASFISPNASGISGINLPILTFKHICKFGNLMPLPANKLHMISFKLYDCVCGVTVPSDSTVTPVGTSIVVLLRYSLASFTPSIKSLILNSYIYIWTT